MAVIMIDHNKLQCWQPKQGTLFSLHHPRQFHHFLGQLFSFTNLTFFTAGVIISLCHKNVSPASSAVTLIILEKNKPKH